MTRFGRFTALCLALVLLLSCAAQTALAGEEVEVRIEGKYLYSDARKMLKLVNKLRTGKNAWYISEDNKTKIKVKGLKELDYDYKLEKVAMQRALEIAAYFSHTRPDGSAWSTAYPSGYNGKGENIAYGYGSAKEVFNAFAEEDKNYAGQGHRRNMLNKKFTKVGFGAVRVGNVIYWVQEFGIGGGKTSDNDRYDGDTVKLSERIFKNVARKVKTEDEELTLEVGGSADIPEIVVISRSGAKMILKESSWKAGDAIIKIKGGKVTGKSAGETRLTAAVAGVSVEVPVTVISDKPSKKDEDKPDEELTTIDDYDPALGTELLFLLEDDECVEIDEE